MGKRLPLNRAFVLLAPVPCDDQVHTNTFTRLVCKGADFNPTMMVDAQPDFLCQGCDRDRDTSLRGYIQMQLTGQFTHAHACHDGICNIVNIDYFWDIANGWKVHGLPTYP